MIPIMESRNFRKYICFLGFSFVVSGCGNNAPEKPTPNPLVIIDSPLELQVSWKKTLGGLDSTGLKPALFQGSVVAAGANGRVVKFGNDGEIIWATDLGETITSGVGKGNDYVVVQKLSGTVVNLDLKSGQIRWESNLLALSTSPPVVGGGLIFFKTNDGFLFAIDAIDGSTTWTEEGSDNEMGLRGNSPLTFDNGYLFVLWDSGRLATYLANDGRIIWERLVSRSISRSPLARLLNSLSSPSVRNGFVATATGNGQVTLTHQSSGDKLWSKDLDASGGALIAFNQVVAVETDGTISAFSLQTGDSLWSQNVLKNRDLSVLGIFDRYLTVTDLDGWLHLLDPRDGNIIARIKVGNAGARVPLQNIRSQRSGVVQLLNGTLAKIELPR